jgi:competence ComEA-like helix-hairpin-helix protein
MNMNKIGLALLAFVFLSAATLMAEPPAPVLKGKTININKATEAELVKNVPLITQELAKKIVKYRKDNGDFQTLEELLQIDGFSRDLLRKIKKFLLLDGIGGKDCTC